MRKAFSLGMMVLGQHPHVLDVDRHARSEGARRATWGESSCLVGSGRFHSSGLEMPWEKGSGVFSFNRTVQPASWPCLQGRAPQQTPFSGNVGHLKETARVRISQSKWPPPAPQAAEFFRNRCGSWPSGTATIVPPRASSAWAAAECECRALSRHPRSRPKQGAVVLSPMETVLSCGRQGCSPACASVLPERGQEGRGERQARLCPQRWLAALCQGVRLCRAGWSWPQVAAGAQHTSRLCNWARSHSSPAESCGSGFPRLQLGAASESQVALHSGSVCSFSSWPRLPRAQGVCTHACLCAHVHVRAVCLCMCTLVCICIVGADRWPGLPDVLTPAAAGPSPPALSVPTLSLQVVVTDEPRPRPPPR